MRLARVGGIDVGINLLLFPCIAVAIYYGYVHELLTSFACVVLHELGHVVVALAYGIKVEAIELLPFGSVARLGERLEVSVGAEIPVALAGPINSAILSLVSYGAGKYSVISRDLAELLMLTNAGLAVFNLVPILPMDGGRLLRAVVAKKMGLIQATLKVASWSRALGLVFAGLFSYLSFKDIHFAYGMVISLFVCIGARKEERGIAYGQLIQLLHKKVDLAKEGIVPVAHFFTPATTTVKDAVKCINSNKYTVFLVSYDSWGIHSSITESQVVEAYLGGHALWKMSDLTSSES